MLSDDVYAQVKEKFSCPEITPPGRANLQYPKLIALMHFKIHQYACPFGKLMTMDTDAMFGKMQLSTIVFTPDAGADLPVLLIDGMQMKKKSLLYAEYYDCTEKGVRLPEAEGQKEEFSFLPDYEEKPAWYMKRRMPCSLIKGGEGCRTEDLEKMAQTCVQRYLAAAGKAEMHPGNLAGLRIFREDMWHLGNPSSGMLKKVLGEKEAEIFFKEVVMPVQDGGK